MKVLLALLLLAGAAHAQVTTLTYQGGPLDAPNYATGNTECQVHACIYGTITLPAPLPANLSVHNFGGNFVVTSMSFQSFSGDGALPNDGGAFNGGNATFSTDAEGRITAWAVFVVNLLADGVTNEVIITTNEGDLVTGGGHPGNPYFSIAGPGTWTQSALVAPPVKSTPGVKVLDCTGYKVVAPSNSLILNVSPSSTGNPSECKVASSVSGSWYVKTTTNGGGTWAWSATLESLGLGKP